MGGIAFNYYQGKEAGQFSFLKIPKVLYTDPVFNHLSSDAKVLYGILLDRMELSMKNGWIDESNRVFIYFTIESIMEIMGWGNKKSIKVLAELDTEKGIGLIEKQRQGQGKPTKIYVKSFIMDDLPDMSKEHLKTCQKDNSRNALKTSQEMSKGHGNDTKTNHTEISDTNLILSSGQNHQNDRLGSDRNLNNSLEAYKEIICENIVYRHFEECGNYSVDEIDNIVDLMAGVCVQEGGTVAVNGNQMPVEIVKSKFLKITVYHIEYIMESLMNNPSEVRNIRSYLLTTIYNAPDTMSQHYRSLYSYNMSRLNNREGD